jgi:hypothetical protein
MIFEALKQPLKPFQTNPKALSEAVEHPSSYLNPSGIVRSFEQPGFRMSFECLCP